MLEVIKRLDIVDSRILSAHYIRGFNYAYGAIADDGWENAIVQDRTYKMFNSMNPEIVASISEISPARKEFFFKLRGEECPSISKASWVRHLFKEAFITLKYDGIASVVRRAAKMVRR